MIKFWYIPPQGFTEDRRTRFGSSDIPKMIPNPEKPTESLAGYGNTAITVYKQKRGEQQPFTTGLEAEMGHYLENKALEWTIRRFSDYGLGVGFRTSKETWENISQSGDLKGQKATDFQVPSYKHNTQYYNDDMIAHPDCVYVPPDTIDTDYEILDEKGNTLYTHKKTSNGIIVDLSKPLIIEAKSAQLFAAKRRDNTIVKGYDFDSLTWHGIPLKHYVQIQFQLTLFQIDVAYLALIYDTSKFQIWRIDANEKWQARIIDLVGRMIKHVKDGTMPRELAMNKADIMEIYPKIDKDYVMLSGESLETTKGLCKEFRHAKQQVKNWKEKEGDAKDALAVMLKDYGELREGSEILAKWQERKGSIGIGKPLGTPENKDTFIKWLKKNDLNAYKYLERKGFIKQGADSRSVSVKFKED